MAKLFFFRNEFLKFHKGVKWIIYNKLTKIIYILEMQIKYRWMFQLKSTRIFRISKCIDLQINLLKIYLFNNIFARIYLAHVLSYWSYKLSVSCYNFDELIYKIVFDRNSSHKCRILFVYKKYIYCLCIKNTKLVASLSRSFSLSFTLSFFLTLSAVRILFIN